MPGTEEREQIWQLQVHPKKTPLAPDVDFRRLAERYAVSGGDIKNAVLKAATAAAAEPGPDPSKKIGQQHFESAMEEVLSAKSVMRQSLFTDSIAVPEPMSNAQNVESRWHTAIVAAVVLAAVALLASFWAVTLAYLR